MEMFIIGSCNTNTKNGEYSVVFDDEGDKEVIHGECIAKSVNEVLLKGLKKGLASCRNHDSVRVYVNTSIGWYNRYKSKNKELIESIMSDCDKRDITVEVVEHYDTSFVKQLVRDYSI